MLLPRTATAHKRNQGSHELSRRAPKFARFFFAQSAQVTGPHSSGKIGIPNHMIGEARYRAAITHLQPLELYIRVEAKAR